VYQTVESFTGEYLPPILAKRKKMNVAFVTYNCVDGHGNGVVNKESSLRVTIVNGGRPLAGLADALPSLLVDARGFIDNQELLAKQAQREISLNKTSPPKLDLLVIYAGIMAFNETLDELEAFKVRSPETLVVVVTCNCSLELKSRKLNTLKHAGLISEVVVGDECGGRISMRRLLEALSAAWSLRGFTLGTQARATKTTHKRKKSKRSAQ
jgi:hypothetical protein